MLGTNHFAQSQSMMKGSVHMLKLPGHAESLHPLIQRYEAVVSNIQEVIFFLDPDGFILEVNDPWEILTGYNIDESVGKNIFDFVSNEELRGISSCINTKIVMRQCYIYTKELKTKVIELTFKPLYSIVGHMYGYSGCLFDITEQLHQEARMKELEAVNHLLEKKLFEEIMKNKHKDEVLIQQSRLVSLSEMVVGIVHQWRQQLNKLSFYFHDVRDALNYGEIEYPYIDQLTKESINQIEEMSRSINDFRKLYKTNKEKMEFSLTDSIEDALSLFESSLKKYHIQIDFKYRGQLTAYGFPNEFTQVVLNILTNAKDNFVRNAKDNRKIVIKIKEMDEFLVATFSNNAGGIEKKALSKPSDADFTAKTNRSDQELYITKMILGKINGSIHHINTSEGALLSVRVPKVKLETHLSMAIIAETKRNN